jgi:hypothetical protein
MGLTNVSFMKLKNEKRRADILNWLSAVPVRDEVVMIDIDLLF